MADKTPISQLPAGAQTGANVDGDADYLAIDDVSAGNTKKIAPRELLHGSLWPTTLSVTSNITLTGTLTVSSTLTANTLASSGATLTGGTINNMVIGGTTAVAGTFTGITGTSVTDSGLTSGRIPYASTGGLLADSANLQWSAANNQLLLGDGSAANPAYSLVSATNAGFAKAFGAAIGVVADGVFVAGFYSADIRLRSLAGLSWASGDPSLTSADLLLARDAANILAQRNGTAAQEFRVWNTFTSLTNGELGKLEWASNVFRVGTEKGSGGGTARELALVTDDTVALTISTAQAATFASSVTSGAPSGGTAGAWKFGVAAVVSPTSPNRTIELDVGGTIYYLHAKTTNN